MRHVVLTRSAYGPDWSVQANRRRLRITRAATAAMMRGQTSTDWRWLIWLDPRDPYLADRMSLYRSSAPEVAFLVWEPRELAPAPWDPRRSPGRLEELAATGYRAPWAEVVGSRDEPLLQTRLDDDDAFAGDALERIRGRAESLEERTILMLPVGFRTYAGRAELVRHDSNAWQSLFTPAGDPLGVYDYGHGHAREVAPVVDVDERPGWLWTRHEATISGSYLRARGTLSDEVRALFPIRWDAIR